MAWLKSLCKTRPTPLASWFLSQPLLEFQTKVHFIYDKLFLISIQKQILHLWISEWMFWKLQIPENIGLRGMHLLDPILHAWGDQMDLPDWLLYTNSCGMGWFFITLFLSILERFWVGNFWISFWNFQKILRRQFFPHAIQRGDPFMPRFEPTVPSIFLSFFESKMVII